MAHPVSLRFRRPELKEQLAEEARDRGLSVSALAEELIDEGLRMQRHPGIVFRPGPAGRRPALLDGPEVWEVIGGLIGGDVPPEERVARSMDLFDLRREDIEVAMAYYAEFTDEIDGWLAELDRLSAEYERSSGQGLDILAR